VLMSLPHQHLPVLFVHSLFIHLFLFYFTFFFFNDPPTTEIYTLSLHDALPISRPTPAISTRGRSPAARSGLSPPMRTIARNALRSEEHTSELQSRSDLVCRLLLEKKKKKKKTQIR